MKNHRAWAYSQLVHALSVRTSKLDRLSIYIVMTQVDKESYDKVPCNGKTAPTL